MRTAARIRPAAKGSTFLPRLKALGVAHIWILNEAQTVSAAADVGVVGGIPGTYTTVNQRIHTLVNMDPAAHFDFGGSPRVDMGVVNLTGYTGLTIGAWARYSVAQGTNPWIIGENPSVGFGAGISLVPYNGNYTAQLGTTGGNYSLNSGYSPIAGGGADGYGHFVVATYDGTALRIYVDGAVKASVAATGTLNGNDDFRIGEDPFYGSPRNWSGEISFGFLHNAALSAANIAQLFTLGNNGAHG